MDTRSYLASEMQNQWDTPGGQTDPTQQSDQQQAFVEEPLSPPKPGTTGAGGRRPLFGIPLATGIGPLDAAWASINESLLVSKIFYFFFYSAFGSLFPLMGVYFKQLGLDAFQTGLLSGVRPLIEMISAPFWSGLADRFRKNKPMLLFSLFCWIIFTASLAFIRPPASACVYFNETHHVLTTPYGEEMDVEENQLGRRRRSADEDLWFYNGLFNRRGKRSSIVTSTVASPTHEKIKFFEEIKPTSARNLLFDPKARNRTASKLKTRHLIRAVKVTLTTMQTNSAADDGPPRHVRRVEDLRRSMRLIPQEESITFIRPDRSPVELKRLRFIAKPANNFHPAGGPKSRSRRQQTGPAQDWDPANNRYPPDPYWEETPYESEEEEEQAEREKEAFAETPKREEAPGGGPEPGKEEDLDKPIPTLNPKSRHREPPNYVVGKSPMTVDYTLNYDKTKHVAYVSPTFSSIVYKWDDVKEVFFLLILLTVLGEFFSSPAITLADTATINYLGDNIDQYSRQRMFGSLGWGITMFFVGMALDNSVYFQDHPCGAHERERNYKVCFTIFSCLMACAWLVATRFEFHNSGSDLRREPSLKVPGAASVGAVGDDLGNGAPGPRPIFNTAPPVNQPGEDGKQSYEFLDKWKSAVFAQRSRGLPPWWTMVKEFANVKCATFFLTAWFMGLGVGMVFSFLFWHLQDIGGTPTLFGYASVINHISEILAYFFSLNLIKQYGHKRVLCLGLACNVVRFTYIAFLFNAWFVLPMEFLQGVTHAACWASLCSYMNTISTSSQMRGSGQAILQTLHHGLGKALGSILGGLLISFVGSRIAFFLYALLTCLVLVLFVYIHCYKRGVGVTFEDDHPLGEGDISLDETALAPHGVPSAPITAQLQAAHQAQQQQQMVTTTDEWGNPVTQAWDDPNAQPQQFTNAGESWGDGYQ